MDPPALLERQLGVACSKGLPNCQERDATKIENRTKISPIIMMPLEHFPAKVHASNLVTCIVPSESIREHHWLRRVLCVCGPAGPGGAVRAAAMI